MKVLIDFGHSTAKRFAGYPRKSTAKDHSLAGMTELTR